MIRAPQAEKGQASPGSGVFVANANGPTYSSPEATGCGQPALADRIDTRSGTSHPEKDQDN